MGVDRNRPKRTYRLCSAMSAGRGNADNIGSFRALQLLTQMRLCSAEWLNAIRSMQTAALRLLMKTESPVAQSSYAAKVGSALIHINMRSGSMHASHLIVRCKSI